MTPKLEIIFNNSKFLINREFLSFAQKYTILDEMSQPLLYAERPRYVSDIIVRLVGMFVNIVFLIVACGFIGLVEDQPGLLIIMYCLGGFVGGILLYYLFAVSFSRKRHITFYTDETKAEKVLEVRQQKKFSVLKSNYTIQEVTRRTIATVQRQNLYNVIRPYWRCFDTQESTVCIIREDDTFIVLLRHLIGRRYRILTANYTLWDENQANELGHITQKASFDTQYLLNVKKDQTEQIDRRIALAIGVLMDSAPRR